MWFLQLGFRKFPAEWGDIISLDTNFIWGIDENKGEDPPNLFDPCLP